MCRATTLAPDSIRSQRELIRMLVERARFPDAVVAAREYVRLSTSNAESHAFLALALAGGSRNPPAPDAADPGAGRRERVHEALVQYQTALQLNPDDAEVLARTAWLLATTGEPALRNGPMAVKMAARACALTGDQDVRWLCSLAAAQAEVGQWEAALATVRRARVLAEAKGLTGAVPQCARLEALFEARKPYRE